MFDRITFDPQIMGGRACIRALRIPVSVIVGQIAHGATYEEILEGCSSRSPATASGSCQLEKPEINDGRHVETWNAIAMAHEDILEGRLVEAVFAANL